MRISPSAFSKLRQCEYMWYVDSVLRVKPRGRGTRPHRDRGNLFHALIEHALRIYAETGSVYSFEGYEGFYQARDVFKQQSEKKGINCEEETARELLDAARWHLPRLGIEQWEILRLGDEPLIERKLECEWSTDHQLSTIVDCVFRHRGSGKVWHVNWKTTAKDVGYLTYVINDHQLLIEREVLRANGIDVDISALCFLRSRAPQPPPLIYGGTKVSRDKSKLTCTWEMYEEAILKLGLSPDDYADIKPVLDTKLFVRWCPDVTSARGEDVMRRDMEHWLEHADALAAEATPRRKLGYGCRDCDYETWCSAAIEHPDGIDIRLLATEYRLRDKSPLAGIDVDVSSEFNPAGRYAEFIARHGRELSTVEEFKP